MMLQRLLLCSLWFALVVGAHAAPPYDLPALNSAAPNYNRFYTNVAIGSTAVVTDDFLLGEEVLNGVLAYLCPTSPVYNNPAYRDRALVVKDAIAFHVCNAEVVPCLR